MKKKLFIVVSFIFFLILIFIGYLTICDLEQEKILKDEINKFADKDITKDRYNTSIKTTGDYQLLRKRLKNT